MRYSNTAPRFQWEPPAAPFIYAGFKPFSLTDVCTRMRAHTHKDVGGRIVAPCRALAPIVALPRHAPPSRSLRSLLMRGLPPPYPRNKPTRCPPMPSTMRSRGLRSPNVARLRSGDAALAPKGRKLRHPLPAGSLRSLPPLPPVGYAAGGRSLTLAPSGAAAPVPPQSPPQPPLRSGCAVATPSRNPHSVAAALRGERLSVAATPPPPHCLSATALKAGAPPPPYPRALRVPLRRAVSVLALLALRNDRRAPVA